MGKDKKDKEAKQARVFAIACLSSLPAPLHLPVTALIQEKEGKKEKRARTDDDGGEAKKAAKEQGDGDGAEECVRRLRLRFLADVQLLHFAGTFRALSLRLRRGKSWRRPS